MQQERSPQATDSISETMAIEDRDPRLFIRSLEKALVVLGAFRYDRSTTVSEVAVRTKIGRSAAQRYIHTWHALGYLRKSEKGYALSARALSISTQLLNTNDILDKAVPYIAEVSRVTLETVTWGVLDDAEYALMFQIPSQRKPYIYTPVGTRYAAIHATSGLAMLAFLPDHRADDIIERCLKMAKPVYTSPDRPTINAILEKVRETGYCITQQILFGGRISVAAPVFDAHDRVIAAVNISTFLERYSREAVEAELAPVATSAAQAITHRIRQQAFPTQMAL